MSILQSTAPTPVLASEKAAQLSPPSSQAPAASLTLDRLNRHTSAVVVDLVAGHDAEDQDLVLRLMEIGFLPGESVRIVGTGFPGPDPLAVRVGQATFALRRHEAAKVLVTLDAKVKP